jgi:hypothetical protein
MAKISKFLVRIDGRRERMRAISLLLIFLSLTPSVLFAESDLLLQVVSFAVTGSDGSKVVVVDRAQCIFRVRSDTFYFNNVYTDRISFQNLHNQLGQAWSTVEIHGKLKVVDVGNVSVQEPAELTKALKDYYREVYEANSTSYTDRIIRVDTRESDRLVKAWQFIYAHGCQSYVPK